MTCLLIAAREVSPGRHPADRLLNGYAALGAAALAAGNETMRIKMDELFMIVAGIWQRDLDLDELSPDDSFVDLAGHSMLALIVIDDINEKLHTDLPPYLLFEEPVLSKFTERVRSEIAGSPGAS
jgi:hypothetical protein